MTIEFNGYKCETKFSFYHDNKNVALLLVGAAGTEDEGEIITVASVNGERKVASDMVGIKTWSENEGIVPVLVDAGVIEPEVQFRDPTGFVMINYHKLTESSIAAVEKAREEMDLQ